MIADVSAHAIQFWDVLAALIVVAVAALIDPTKFTREHVWKVLILFAVALLVFCLLVKW